MPLLIFLFITFVFPMLGVLARSVEGSDLTVEHYQTVAESSTYRGILGDTFRIAAVTMVVTAIIGYPLAYWIVNLTPKWRIIAVILVVLPFWTSILVRTYAWIVILGFRGVINEALIRVGILSEPIQLVFNEFGVILGTVHVLMPFMVLPLLAAMMAVDSRLTRAGSSLGGRPLTVFWRIFFPLTLPAFAAGAILVFIMTLAFFVTPAVLGGGRVPMISTVLETLINRSPRWELAAALSMVLLVASLLFYGVYQRVGKFSR